MPALAQGVVGLMREFDQLREMSERESVPVPFLQRHHLNTMQGAAYQQFLNVLANNPNAPLPADAQFLVPINNRNAMEAKVRNIYEMTRLYMMMIDAL